MAIDFYTFRTSSSNMNFSPVENRFNLSFRARCLNLFKSRPREPKFRSYYIKKLGIDPDTQINEGSDTFYCCLTSPGMPNIVGFIEKG